MPKNIKNEIENDISICLKGRSRIQRTYSDARVQYRMKRATYTTDDPHPENRGKDEWERISWDEAVEMVSKKWLAVEKWYTFVNFFDVR